MSAVPEAEINRQVALKNDFNAHGFKALSATGIVVCTILVGLRLWSRRWQKIGWKADDYVIMLAWALMVPYSAIFYSMVNSYGLGRHWLIKPMPIMVGFLKREYTLNLCYSSYQLSKISLCILYKRIFILVWFTACCWGLIAIFVGYLIGTFITNIFLSVPVRAHWTPTLKPDRVVDQFALYHANIYFNLVTDTILFLLPLSVVWTLKMSRAKRVGLSGVFAIGALTIVTAIMRITVSNHLNPLDPSYSLVPAAFWTQSELFLALICATLPTLGPMVRQSWELVLSNSSLRRYLGHSLTRLGVDVSRRLPEDRLGSDEGEQHGHDVDGGDVRDSDVEKGMSRGAENGGVQHGHNGSIERKSTGDGVEVAGGHPPGTANGKVEQGQGLANGLSGHEDPNVSHRMKIEQVREGTGNSNP